MTVGLNDIKEMNITYWNLHTLLKRNSIFLQSFCLHCLEIEPV